MIGCHQQQQAAAQATLLDGTLGTKQWQSHQPGDRNMAATNRSKNYVAAITAASRCGKTRCPANMVATRG